jgi:hypothetical protein
LRVPPQLESHYSSITQIDDKLNMKKIWFWLEMAVLGRRWYLGRLKNAEG